MNTSEDDDLLREFLAESRDHLSSIEADMLAIEERGADIDDALVNKVFRAAHSIKGGSAFFGLSKIQELAHMTETALSLIRSKEMIPNPEIVNILLQSFDKLRDLVNHVEQSKDADISDHLVALSGLNASFLTGEKKKNVTSQMDASFGKGKAVIRLPALDVMRARDSGKQIYLLRYDLIADIERAGRTPLSVINELQSIGEIMDACVHFESVGTLEDGPIKEIPFDVVITTILREDVIGAIGESASIDPEKIFALDEPSTNKTSQMEPAAKAEPSIIQTPHPEPVATPTMISNISEAPGCSLETEPATPIKTNDKAVIKESSKPAVHDASTASNSGVSSTSDNTLRVNVSVLETLMNLAGELVLSRNQLREALSRHDERAVGISSQRLNLVTSDLQEAIMQTRLQPVGNVFGKFPRVVRDLSRNLGKDIQLDVEGREVEMDKTLIEGLTDPLTHMIRNAVDHGIETPEERIRQGKKPQGTIGLKAYHEAGQVVIQISDDGKGIDPVRVANSALKKGLITSEKLQGLSEKEKIALIFLPGLSTVEKVSDVSGRGVGMDVVKTNLDRLGGKVEIDSTVGKGSLFRIKLPLTLAIIPSLIVTVKNERYAVPQVNVVELIRVPADQVRNRIEMVGDAEVLLLRGSLIPIVRLADVVGIGSNPPAVEQGKKGKCNGDAQAGMEPTGKQSWESSQASSQTGEIKPGSADLNIVVVSSGTLQYGVIVDSLRNTEEIVVKPLGRHLKRLIEYAGATIMGDGRVALILDVSGLATKASMSSVSTSTRAVELAGQQAQGQQQDAHSLLVFHNAPGETCAVPLDLVLRVEKVASHQIETIGGRRTMQYRGVSLPLVTLADTAKVQSLETSQEWAVIVFRMHEKEVGLLGAMPVDVVETKVVFDLVTLRQKGVAGSSIIRDHTALLVDLHELVDEVYPEWKAEKPPGPLQAPGAAAQSILLAEDSDFFRAQVKRFLVAEGYTVLEAPDGEAAWELLLENEGKVNAIVTDIEMPRLTGLGLSQRVRADKRFSALPIIGLTSLAGEDDIAKGKAAGISEYQVKLDRDKLVETLRSIIHIEQAAS